MALWAYMDVIVCLKASGFGVIKLTSYPLWPCQTCMFKKPATKHCCNIMHCDTLLIWITQEPSIMRSPPCFVSWSFQIWKPIINTLHSEPQECHVCGCPAQQLPLKRVKPCNYNFCDNDSLKMFTVISIGRRGLGGRDARVCLSNYL